MCMFQKTGCGASLYPIQLVVSDTAGRRLKQNFFNLQNFALIAFEHPHCPPPFVIHHVISILGMKDSSDPDLSKSGENVSKISIFLPPPTIYHSDLVCSAVQFTMHNEETNLLQMVRLMFLTKKDKNILRLMFLAKKDKNIRDLMFLNKKDENILECAIHRFSSLRLKKMTQAKSRHGLTHREQSYTG